MAYSRFASCGEFAQPSFGYLLTAVRRQGDGLCFSAMMLVISAATYLTLVRAGDIGAAARAMVISQTIWIAGAYVWLRIRWVTAWNTPVNQN